MHRAERVGAELAGAMSSQGDARTALEPAPAAGVSQSAESAEAKAAAGPPQPPPPPPRLEPPLTLRPLAEGDMAKGYLDLLAYLSKVGRVTEEQWRRRFASMFAFEPPKYYVVVVEDTRAARVVATATLMVEFKFLRSCGEAGHVEDVVVDPAYRGKHLGLVVVAELLRVAAARGLYKVILNCNDRNVPFYEKLGFVRKDNQMAIYREPRDAT